VNDNPILLGNAMQMDTQQETASISETPHSQETLATKSGQW